MTWKDAKKKYHPYKLYFIVSKQDVLKLPHKKIGGIITCLPVNQGFSSVFYCNDKKERVRSEDVLQFGYSSLTGPKAYRIADSLDRVGIRYALFAHGSGPASEFDTIVVRLRGTLKV